MTMSAVVTMYAFGLLYFASTGTYYFFDSYIPIAVFLGMHLLFNDPSTSPRTELGRIIFGVVYALGVIALYTVLDRSAVPTFYDKLLAVPVMNLTIQAIDRLAHAKALRRFDPAALARGLAGPGRHLGYVGVWAAVFIAMSAAQGVGDNHRGQWVPFWQQACTEGRPYACRNLGNLVSNYCRARSGWACNEFGILLDPRRAPEFARRAFRDACDLGFEPGCAQHRSERVECATTDATRSHGLPDRSAGSKGTNARHDIPRALPARLRAGVSGWLPAGWPCRADSPLTVTAHTPAPPS